MTTVLEHFQVAEYIGSDFSHPVSGHTYSYHNDPAGHDNHVHVAFLPWAEPDAPNSTPPVATWPTGKAAEFTRWYFRTDDLSLQGAPLKPDPRVKGTAWGGCVGRTHRNSDPAQPWSQHTEGNAVDIMADHAQADAVLTLLAGPYEEEEEEEDDVAVTKDDYEQRAFTWGQKERWQKRARPTKSPNLDHSKPDENYLGAAQAGWDKADHDPGVPALT